MRYPPFIYDETDPIEASEPPTPAFNLRDPLLLERLALEKSLRVDDKPASGRAQQYMRQSSIASATYSALLELLPTAEAGKGCKSHMRERAESVFVSEAWRLWKEQRRAAGKSC